MRRYELTEREAQVASMIARGAATKHIARALDISIKTVECHRANIRAKLGGTNAACIVVWAVKNGLVDA